VLFAVFLQCVIIFVCVLLWHIKQIQTIKLFVTLEKLLKVLLVMSTEVSLLVKLICCNGLIVNCRVITCR